VTAVLDRIPVEQITADAKKIDAGRAVLSLLALIPFIIGWIAGKTVLAVAWAGLAVKAGWLEARRPKTTVDGG
jgi:hypothetical protein